MNIEVQYELDQDVFFITLARIGNRSIEESAYFPLKGTITNISITVDENSEQIVYSIQNPTHSNVTYKTTEAHVFSNVGDCVSALALLIDPPV